MRYIFQALEMGTAIFVTREDEGEKTGRKMKEQYLESFLLAERSGKRVEEVYPFKCGGEVWGYRILDSSVVIVARLPLFLNGRIWT